MFRRFGLEHTRSVHFGWDFNQPTSSWDVSRTRSRLPTGEIANRDPSASQLAGHFSISRLPVAGRDSFRQGPKLPAALPRFPVEGRGHRRGRGLHSAIAADGGPPLQRPATVDNVRAAT